MPKRYDSLNITPLFEIDQGDGVTNANYREVVLLSLKALLPPEFFDSKEDAQEARVHQKQILQKAVPLITSSKNPVFPGTQSFMALSNYRQNSFKFFYEMINRWLTPGRCLNVVLLYATDFKIPDLGEEVYTICQIMINVDDQMEFNEIHKNFPLISAEIALGMQSEFYANRILELKGFAPDDKTVKVQGIISLLVKRFPHYYSTAVFSEMQHVLVTCQDEFKASRQARHLSRMISVQYLFRKVLREAIKKKPNRRHLYLKFFRAKIQTPSGGPKPVLCLLLGVNFLRDHENIGEKNLLKAVQHFIPSTSAVEHSFYIHKLGSENICISYLEVEKKDGTNFTAAEIRKMSRELPGNIKNRIEHRQHNVFMPRNEEEVMRNILTLTNQIKYMRDLPQVLITFDEQAYAHLYFTVILARLVKSESSSVAELFKRVETHIEYLPERTKVTGYVRKKYPKEASVFRLKLPKDHFLRDDHSIDLFKARQTIVKELTKVLGDVRDYNGGMISKQHELLTEIRRSLSDNNEYDELLLENFFFSLAPVVARALLEPAAFKTLFLMLIEGLKEYKQEGHYIHFQSENKIFALMIVEDLSLKESIQNAIHDLQIPTAELVYAYVKTHGNHCMGYICSSRDQALRKQFIETIGESLKNAVN